jgi:hypothetical protein
MNDSSFTFSPADCARTLLFRYPDDIQAATINPNSHIKTIEGGKMALQLTAHAGRSHWHSPTIYYDITITWKTG